MPKEPLKFAHSLRSTAAAVAAPQDRLPCLPPEVVQALVEHCAVELGRPDRVECCVLHLDVFSLDLDQVGKEVQGLASGEGGCSEAWVH